MDSDWELSAPWTNEERLAESVNATERELLGENQLRGRARVRLTAGGLAPLKSRGGRPAVLTEKRKRDSVAAETTEGALRSVAEQSDLKTVRLLALDTSTSWCFDVDEAARLETVGRVSRAEPSQHSPHDVFHVAFLSANKPVLSQELLFLADHTLQDLRKAVRCSKHAEEQQNAPEAFFIENVFYDDARNGVDRLSDKFESYLSERRRIVQSDECPALEFNASTGRERFFRPPETTSLDGFRDQSLRSVQLKLGVPYVFIHHESCEHLFMFLDFRQTTCLEPSRTTDFPHAVRVFAPKSWRCEVCDICFASNAVFNDRLATDSPMFFCEDCFRKLHYDDRGRLLDAELQICELS